MTEIIKNHWKEIVMLSYTFLSGIGIGAAINEIINMMNAKK